MIIKPYGEISTDNFPALKHFFPCDEADSATTLTDSVGGVTIPVAGGVTKAGNALKVPDQSAVAITGTWAALSGTAVMFVVMDADVTGAAAVQVSIGGALATDNIIIIGGNSVGTGFLEGVTAELTTTNAQVTEGGVAIRCTPGTGADIWNVSTSAITKGTGGSSGTPAAWPTLTSKFSIGSLSGTGGGNGLYGFGLLDFASPPSDTEMGKAIAWMAAQFINGNKWIYPGWEGIS